MSAGGDAPSPPKAANDGTGGLIGIIAAAAVAVGSFFGLFGGLLSGIAPPVDIAGKPFAASAAQMFTCLGVLVVYAVALSTKALKSTAGWAVAAGVLGLASLARFAVYQRTYDDLVFVYPPTKVVHIAGTERKTEVRNDPKSAAMGNADVLFEWGGDPVKVWDDQARRSGRERLFHCYLGFVTATAGAFFCLAELVRRFTVRP